MVNLLDNMCRQQAAIRLIQTVVEMNRAETRAMHDTLLRARGAIDRISPIRLSKKVNIGI